MNYVADDYVEAVTLGRGMPTNLGICALANENIDVLERNAMLQSPSRIEELVQIFIHATKVS